MAKFYFDFDDVTKLAFLNLAPLEQFDIKKWCILQLLDLDKSFASMDSRIKQVLEYR
jgi:hypothetical protein